MAVGRNDPCPCGSGQKYKKCCLAKDEAAAPRYIPALQPEPAAAATPLAPGPPAPPKPTDPRQAAREARWGQFEQADPEQRAALFLRTLDEPDLMDAENAFGMLEALYNDSVEGRQRDRWETLLEALRQRLPEVYEQDKSFYLGLQIDNAIGAGRYDALRQPVRELAELGGKAMDTLVRALDRLAYHGQLPLLLEAVRLAWPCVRGSEDVLPWAIEEFADRGVDYELFDLIQRRSDVTAEDPELLERVHVYYEKPDLENLRRWLDRVLDRSRRRWRLEEFDAFLRPPQRRRGRDAFDEFEHDEQENEQRQEQPDEATMALLNLSHEFLGWLHREEHVPYEKAELARNNLVRYLHHRAAWELSDTRSYAERMLKGERRRPKPRPIAHPLCPDATTFDTYLARCLGPLAGRIYDAVLTVELAPAWLRFLESRALLDRARGEQFVRGMAKGVATIRELLENDREDPMLREALRDWPSQTRTSLPDLADR